MREITFNRPLTALEVRDPAIDVCAEIASEHGLYADFHQPQQGWTHRYEDTPGGRKIQARIGNALHKNWFIDYQTDPRGTNKPHILGRIALVAPFIPPRKEFGGWNYGDRRLDSKFAPKYRSMTVKKMSEYAAFMEKLRQENYFNPQPDPDPALFEETCERLAARFEQLD